MTPASSNASERLFSHYLDQVDGTLCLPACADMAVIRKLASPHKLRFPLSLDPQVPLSGQISSATHTPASHRFGPFCDNIIGMNWRLPTGRMVRIGERVVKTTTGYDWHRFLLHSGNRFGEATDYVLRLRPDCGSDTLVFFKGSVEDLTRSASTLLRSGWMHWFDALDFTAADQGCFLRLWIHTIPGELHIFMEHLARVADLTRTEVEIQRNAGPPEDGIPDLAIKTTPDCAIDLAVNLSGCGVRCSALCYSGVVHAWLPQSMTHSSHIESLIEPFLENILKAGGDWHSRHVHSRAPNSSEAAWIEILEEALHGT